jgi:hypothetical protein
MELPSDEASWKMRCGLESRPGRIRGAISMSSRSGSDADTADRREHVMGRMVTVQWVKGMKVEGAAGPHRLAMDAPPEAGGGDEAPSPAELLLGAIGA